MFFLCVWVVCNVWLLCFILLGVFVDITAPAKALDDEDVEYFDELSKRKAAMDAKISVEEEQMLASYRTARSSTPAAEAPAALLNHKPKPQQKKATSTAP